MVSKKRTRAKRTQADPWAKPIIEFASKHFILVSALTIVGGVLCATIFLYGYLLIFDWRLIWIIEYTDVLKVGLVAVAIVSSSLLARLESWWSISKAPPGRTSSQPSS
jgi:hypothetical protein